MQWLSEADDKRDAYLERPLRLPDEWRVSSTEAVRPPGWRFKLRVSARRMSVTCAFTKPSSKHHSRGFKAACSPRKGSLRQVIGGLRFSPDARPFACCSTGAGSAVQQGQDRHPRRQPPPPSPSYFGNVDQCQDSVASR